MACLPWQKAYHALLMSRAFRGIRFCKLMRPLTPHRGRSWPHQWPLKNAICNKGNGSTCLTRRNLPKKRYFSKKSFCFGLRHVILYLNIRSRKSAMTTDVALRELPRLVCHIWLRSDPGQSVQPSRAEGYVPSLSGRGRSLFASVVYIERNASI